MGEKLSNSMPDGDWENIDYVELTFSMYIIVSN